MVPTELAVGASMHFLPATQDGVLSIFRISSNMQLKVPAILFVSIEARHVKEQLNVLEIIRNSKSIAVASLMASKAVETIKLENPARTEFNPFAYFESISFVAFSQSVHSIWLKYVSSSL